MIMATPRISYNDLIGIVIREARLHAGKNQGEIAEAFGIQQPSYSRWEAGGTSVTLVQLRQFADIVRADWPQLVDRLVEVEGAAIAAGIEVTTAADVASGDLYAAFAVIAHAGLLTL